MRVNKLASQIKIAKISGIKIVNKVLPWRCSFFYKTVVLAIALTFFYFMDRLRHHYFLWFLDIIRLLEIDREK